MKTYALLIALYFTFAVPSSATIRNGYADIAGARASLKSIQLLLKKEKNLPLLERESMKNKRDALIRYITYHELTETFLKQFKRIAPDLYHEIDTLKDSKARNADVYIRFVAEEELPAGIAGTTNVEQDQKDPHAYRSEYGINTVSVTIVAGRKSLTLLAHELGHVQYQVQHLQQYMEFYNSQYGDNYNRKSVGHNDNDASGKRAYNFVNRFQEQYTAYLKAGKGKLASHLVLLQEIRKAIEAL